jgi:hypothetical protein
MTLERRRHRALITKNTEYHLKDGICVAVRDRKTGQWCREHPALTMRLVMVSSPDGGPTNSHPVGGRAYFLDESQRNLLTSLVERVVRPPREAVSVYRQLEGHA